MVMAIMTMSFAYGAPAGLTCTFSDTGDAKQPCVKELGGGNVLTISCPKATEWKPEELSASTSKVCKVDMAEKACATTDQAAFNSIVSGVTVAKNSSTVTV